MIGYSKYSGYGVWKYGNDSGTEFAFQDPSTGKKELYGEYLLMLRVKM